MANQAPTTTLPTFSSLAASRPQRWRPAPTELAIAFQVLQASIAGTEQPFEPKYEADLAEWAEHLEQVLQASLAYARAVVAHLDDVTPGGIPDETGGLHDAAGDTVGALRNAANRLAEDVAA